MAERMNQTPETRDKIEEKESKGLRNTVLTSAAAALLALNIQIGDGKNLENGQTVSIPESEVLEQVERKGVGDRISEGIKSMLAKGVNFVIPPAHAWDDIAEDDSMKEQYEESQQELEQSRSELEQSRSELEQSRSELEQSREGLEMTGEMGERLEEDNEMVNILTQYRNGNASRSEAFEAINTMENNLQWFEENKEYSDEIDFDWIQEQRQWIEEQRQTI
ncbi:hypothetical protein [Candidatus Absconditicoccus praedator]|uniref:hypothetical protein n=1 Tax=Candidatus Absconditicoccus praedator TaxID=2735562 RepID=UPI001E42CAD3|nr:hypothetical protein [Candidatus Absconditicoccus praedator]UFX83123.1 hypothetical protein HLG78_03240 [Candidatus Absconditicoccus praedator]